jgi:Protein of unknown function (DUF4242)
MYVALRGRSLDDVPRYLIERNFPTKLEIRVAEIVERNEGQGVTWLHSYVSDDGRRAFDLYEAPSPEAIRSTSARNALPVERITEVRVLDPYSYAPE